jgi:hypothetical protein
LPDEDIPVTHGKKAFSCILKPRHSAWSFWSLSFIL